MERRIEKPLFLRQYSDNVESLGIELKYLENSYSKDQIVSVDFPEVGIENIITNSASNITNSNITAKTINVFFNEVQGNERSDRRELTKDGDVTITKMIYKTSTGKSEEVNLGEIIIAKPFVYDKKYKILESIGIESSSDYSGKYIYKAKDDLKVIDIECENLDNIKRLFNIYINGIELENLELPIKIDRDRPIEIYYEIKEGLKEEDFEVEEYSMNLKLKCSDPEGTIDYIRANLKIGIDSIVEVTKSRFIKDLNKKLEGS
ncbi:hypothetical protein KPL40_00605 [Clostridium gasigenes]|uniref:hypothetical protein n=1 Tax=Clostridium gasigenes TaxID=94869 RepID=UPI001C0DCA89|nr:hypothetical protein [Clostridium gasigenes]MBU3130940.1 hypothetical protein [Clostridium gasigenes]